MPFAMLPEDDLIETFQVLQPDRFNHGYSLALQGRSKPKDCPVASSGWDAGRRLAEAAVGLYERAVKTREIHDVELDEVFGSCVCNRCRQPQEITSGHAS